MNDNHARIASLTNFYHKQAITPDGLALFENYGIRAAMVAKFRLGYIGEPESQSHETYEGQYIVPYLTVTPGRVDLLRVSPFEFDGAGRYDLIHLIKSDRRSLSHPLFNISNAMPGIGKSRVWVTDEVLSAIKLKQVGERAVAVPGWHNWRSYWCQLMLNQNVNLVVKRDQEAAQKVSQEMQKKGIRFNILHLEQEDDISELVEESDADEVIEQYRARREW